VERVDCVRHIRGNFLRWRRELSSKQTGLSLNADRDVVRDSYSSENTSLSSVIVDCCMLRRSVIPHRDFANRPATNALYFPDASHALETAQRGEPALNRNLLPGPLSHRY